MRLSLVTLRFLKRLRNGHMSCRFPVLRFPILRCPVLRFSVLHFSILRLPVLLLAPCIAALLLTGCEDQQYSSADEKDLKQAARTTVESWISANDPEAKIKTLEAHTARPELLNQKTYLTDYAMGTCTSGDKTYSFAVNAVTGALFTGRDLDAFAEALGDQLQEELGINPDARKIRIHTSRPMLVSASKPELGEYYFQDLLPADIPDMESFAREALNSEEMAVYLDVAYNGVPLEVPAEMSASTQEETPAEASSEVPAEMAASTQEEAPAEARQSGGSLPQPAGNSVVRIYRLQDTAVQNSELPGFDMSFAPVFTSELLEFKQTQTTFVRYGLDESASPLLLHYPAEIVKLRETSGGSQAAAEESLVAAEGNQVSSEKSPEKAEGGREFTKSEYSAGESFSIDLQSPQRVLVHLADTEETKGVDSHLLLRDYSAADGIPQVLFKERSDREWYHDYLEWEPVCGLYVLGAYQSPERLQNQDIFVFGETGQVLLKQQTEENEKRLKEEKK